jgi:ATP-dependent helicase/nuclease subunit A
VLDFNDLERYALKVLDHPEAVEHYQHRWKAFLVDEFQDTNQVQAEILDRLTRIAKLTIVGDEKQSIYGFRGADPNVFSRVRDEIVEIRGGQHVPLTKTYRAHHGLVEAMNLIFAPVLDVLHQPLEAARVDSQLSEPFLHSAVVGESRGTPKSRLQILEARYIADQIKSLHDEQNVAYKDIAILARRWAPLEVYLGVLSANGIPAVNVGGGSLLETREAKDIYALFSFLSEPSDAIPLAAVLRSPFFAVSDLTLLNAAPELNNRSWWRAIQDRPEFAHAVDILNTLLDARQLSSSEQILSLALSLTGYESVIANLPYGTRRVADLRGMRELFQRLERKGRGDTFGTTRYLRELIETETDIPRPQLAPGEAVSLMTIHRAKGLEWPVVFVPDLACERYVDNAKVLIDSEVGIAFQMDGEAFEKQQPAIHKLIRARKREREAAEARRLLYVAITRAKDKVILTATRKGSTREKDLDIDILRPGLDAAGIEDEIIPYVEALAVAPAPIEPAALPVPDEINIGPVRTSLRELPATSLTVYAKCPKRFEYQFVNGHPGIGEGYASAMAIGSLTHIALENDITDPAALLRFSPESTAEQAREAIELANAFRENPAFASVRSGVLSTEEPFRYDAGPIGINGVADLVGMDFVLDYKTDAEVDRDEHRFQLWAYAEAFKKEKAYVAYLRHNKLIEYTCDELARSREDAHLMLDKIAGGVFEATPSEKACSACAYRSICDKKYEGAIAVEVGAQLSLF